MRENSVQNEVRKISSYLGSYRSYDQFLQVPRFLGSQLGTRNKVEKRSLPLLLLQYYWGSRRRLPLLLCPFEFFFPFWGFFFIFLVFSWRGTNFFSLCWRKFLWINFFVFDELRNFSLETSKKNWDQSQKSQTFLQPFLRGTQSLRKRTKSRRTSW